MDVGIDLLATRTFKQQMPTEAQLEHGIMLVEDAAMPMARLIPPSNVFVTRDPYLLEVGQQALGVRDVATAWKASGRLPMLSREAVEGQFDMLARQACAPPSAARGSAAVATLGGRTLVFARNPAPLAIGCRTLIAWWAASSAQRLRLGTHRIGGQGMDFRQQLRQAGRSTLHQGLPALRIRSRRIARCALGVVVLHGPAPTWRFCHRPK